MLKHEQIVAIATIHAVHQRTNSLNEYLRIVSFYGGVFVRLILANGGLALAVPKLPIRVILMIRIQMVQEDAFSIATINRIHSRHIRDWSISGPVGGGV